MKIKVIGKQHRQGTSQKTGQPYDFIVAHYVGSSPWVEGECGQSLNLDPSMISYEALHVGSTYEVSFGPYNRVTDFKEVR